MISFKNIMHKILLTELTFKELVAISNSKGGMPGCQDNSRMDRSKNVMSRSSRVKAMDDGERWTFNYKSQGPHSTTGDRHHGLVQFSKKNVNTTDENAEDLECKVHCSCPDYLYRWEYNNAKAGAGKFCSNHNKQAPQLRDDGGVGRLGEGLCKHLIALGKFLETKVDAPQPDDEPPTQISTPKPEPKLNPSVSSVGSLPSTSNAPQPDDNSSYSDSRTDSVRENLGSSLFERMSNFVKTNPVFDITYED